jgi:hypothetical protein
VPDATERTLAIQRGAQPGVAVPPFAVYSVLVFGGA